MSKELQHLLHAINVRKYATGDPKDALLMLMNEVEMKVHHFRKECWNIVIEVLADYLGLMQNPWKYSLPNIKWTEPTSKPSYHGLQDLKKQLSTDMIEAYVVAAKAKPWDHLGEIFTEEQLAGRKNRLGQILTPKNIVDFMIKMTLDSRKRSRPDNATLEWLNAENWNYEIKMLELSRELRLEYQRLMNVLDMKPTWEKYQVKPETLMDPCVGTGRFLIEASILHPADPLILFGIELDPSLYRACLVNMAMFSNHPYTIICGDTLMLDVDHSGPSSPLWSLGNRWEPKDISEYYWKEPPITPKKFSLSAFAGIKQENKPESR